MTSISVAASRPAPLAAPEIERSEREATGARPATESGDKVTLSGPAQRLLTARENLKAREGSTKTNSADEWLRLNLRADIEPQDRAGADREIAAMEAADPDHADLAKQARTFNLTRARGGAVVNPFANLDIVSLTAIFTDEADVYTHDERAAAITAKHDKEKAWTSVFTAIGGRAFYEEAKRQYGLLSDLEKTRYGPGYEARCEVMADYAEERGDGGGYWWMDPESDDPKLTSIFDLIQRAMEKVEENAVPDGAAS